MPIKIPNDLPAVKTLNNENIFVMTETRAITQDIRPLKILLLNLMPKKIETETQISRLLGNSPLQVDLEFLHTKSHVSKNTSAEHLFTFYKTFEDVRDRTFDGMIITGGKPVNGGFVNAQGDHRIAMSAAAASAGVRNSVTVDDMSCIAKSYPNFLDDFASFGGQFRVTEK